MPRLLMIFLAGLVVTVVQCASAAAQTRTDYKFWYIQRDDAGFITEVGIRFYEGAVASELERNSDTGTLEPVTRYRRSARLTEAQMAYLGTGFVTESSGARAKRYTAAQFGRIKTDTQLRDFLDLEIQKDLTREPIDEQKAGTIRPRR
jgi:hypothetical protein